MSLESLISIITANVKTIEETYSSHDAPLPSLNDPVVKPPTSLDTDPMLIEAKQLIVAAATQLIAMIQSPAESVMESTAGMFTTALLGFVVEANVADVLGGHGEQGLHVNEISKHINVDASYLSRVLRYLATRHIFREVSPDVFANNKISSLIRKAKTLEEIKSDPLGKFDGSPLSAYVSLQAEQIFKSTAFLSDFLQNPKTANAPFNIAFNTNERTWDWYQQSGNEWRSRRSTAAVKGGGDSRYPKHIFTDAFAGLSLNDNDVVVDVGGSIGSLAAVLKKAYPQVSYVVQDLERQIVDAKVFWNDNDPEAISSGKVKLQVHDFFTPQPIHSATVYMLRVVIHDWPDVEAIKILSLLRSAASDVSKLIIFDNIAQHTCRDPENGVSGTRKAVPKPLLANLGVGGAGFATCLDMQMLTLFNGKERTVAEFKELGERTGWKLEIFKSGVLGTMIFTAI